MSWDSKSAPHRRRSTLTSRPKKDPKQPVQPSSAHVADPFLQPFLDPAFDPADYLNATLPPLHSQSSYAVSRPQEGALPLAELSAHAQTHLSQLNAHSTRLTSILSQLTDEILRSGSRLAYEVELLRGETLALSEALTDGLHSDVAKFLPDGLRDKPESRAQKRLSSIAAAPTPQSPSAPSDPDAPPLAVQPNATDPQFLTQLRILTTVRERLDSVVHIFGDAMEFVFPPSELSVSSSFLSVSAPEPGQDSHSTEEKGQQVLKKLRDEIFALLANPSDPIAGIEKAAQRIQELKELAVVWKGTGEEKGRTKFIDSLSKTVEDRHEKLVREMESGGRQTKEAAASQRKTASSSESAAPEAKPAAGYGLMSQWQRLRTGL